MVVAAGCRRLVCEELSAAAMRLEPQRLPRYDSHAGVGWCDSAPACAAVRERVVASALDASVLKVMDMDRDKVGRVADVGDVGTSTEI